MELTRPPRTHLQWAATRQLITDHLLQSRSFIHFCLSVLKNRFMRSFHKLQKYVMLC